jgi:uncharacterized membrane protein
MSGGDVVYGLIAWLVIVLLGFAFRPRRGGQRTTADERVEAFGWVLVAWFFIFVLQLAGAAKEFAIASTAAGVVLIIYLLGKRLARKPGR